MFRAQLNWKFLRNPNKSALSNNDKHCMAYKKFPSHSALLFLLESENLAQKGIFQQSFLLCWYSRMCRTALLLFFFKSYVHIFRVEQSQKVFFLFWMVKQWNFREVCWLRRKISNKSLSQQFPTSWKGRFTKIFIHKNHRKMKAW